MLLFWTALAAVAASASAMLAAIYTFLTYRLVRSQSEPNVVVYVRHDDSRASMLQIVIENIGRGLATDIIFQTDRKIPSRAFGMSIEAAQRQPAEVMATGPLVEGIQSLGPGDSRRVTWGQYWGLKHALGDSSITLQYSYYHGKRRMRPVTAILDVKSFAATDAVESDAARVIKQLTRVADSVQRLVDQE